ncbi:MAG: hypothetical protein Q7S33_01385, partial [Nanoarchaeota archaeon]|nr:hypothetical protein [Nanoarchaeota archaeon]
AKYNECNSKTDKIEKEKCILSIYNMGAVNSQGYSYADIVLGFQKDWFSYFTSGSSGVNSVSKTALTNLEKVEIISSYLDDMDGLDLNSKYSANNANKAFVDTIYEDHIFEPGYYSIIIGEKLGGVGSEKNMNYVRDLLFHYLLLVENKDLGTLNEKRALGEINFRSLKTKYSDNSEFVNDLHAKNLITDAEYKNIKGGEVFNLEENMNFVKQLLLK